MIACEWCGELMGPPFKHLLGCVQLDVVAVAERIVAGGDFVDAEAEVVARAYLELQGGRA